MIVPAHTYIASALAVVHAGARPGALRRGGGHRASSTCDAAAAAVGPRTAAILAVHLNGQLCDMPALQRLAARHGLALFEDAAQAHGATCEGRRAGAFGHRGGVLVSIRARTSARSGTRGAICTNDPGLATRARRIRNLGQRRKGEHVLPGVNERLDGLQAALLRVKLAGA